MTNVLKSDENFARRIISVDENFALQDFAKEDNQNFSKGIGTLLLVLKIKTLLLLLGEIFRRAKVTNSSFGDENFARQSLAR